MSVHQKIMNQAYGQYDEYRNYDHFVKGISEIERQAVLTGIMNYQVENGGFIQWFDNNYGTTIAVQEIVKVAEMIKTPVAAKVKELMTKYLEAVDDACDDPYNLRDGEWEYINHELGLLDYKYYAISGRWLKELDQFFQQTEAEPDLSLSF